MLALRRRASAVLLGQLAPASTSSRGFATHGVGESQREGGVQRFYKEVSVKPMIEADETVGYEILLDKRVLKTPARRPLILPSSALAHAIAAEWESQKSRVQPFTMPLMSLAATAADAPRPREEVEESLVGYLSTDLLLCREGRGEIARAQARAYEPLLEALRERTGAQLRASSSVFGADLPPSDLGAISRLLRGLDQWRLTAVEQLSGAARSTLLGIMTIEGIVDVQRALELARLEDLEQIREWGLVEGAHDIDAADIAVRIAAPSVFVRLLELGKA